jgi:hypothetical protein
MRAERALENADELGLREVTHIGASGASHGVAGSSSTDLCRRLVGFVRGYGSHVRRAGIGMVAVVVLSTAVFAARAVVDATAGRELGPTSLRATDECSGKPLSCVMTDEPGIRGVVLPRRDLQFGSLHEPFDNRLDIWSVNTRYGSADDYIGFYESFMPANGWQQVPDETRTLKDGSGSTTRFLVWERPGNVRLATIVSAVVDDEYGAYVGITINNQYGLECFNSDCSWPDGTHADLSH